MFAFTWQFCENVWFVWLEFYISFFRIFPPIRVPSFSSDLLFALVTFFWRRIYGILVNSSARMLRVSSKFQIVTNKTKITLTLTALTSLFLLRFFYIYHSFLLFSAWSVNLCFAWTGKQRQLTLSYLQLIKPAAGRPLGFWEILTRPKKMRITPLTKKDKDQILKKIWTTPSHKIIWNFLYTTHKSRCLTFHPHNHNCSILYILYLCRGDCRFHLNFIFQILDNFAPTRKLCLLQDCLVVNRFPGKLMLKIFMGQAHLGHLGLCTFFRISIQDCSLHSNKQNDETIDDRKRNIQKLMN